MKLTRMKLRLIFSTWSKKTKNKKQKTKTKTKELLDRPMVIKDKNLQSFIHQ